MFAWYVSVALYTPILLMGKLAVFSLVWRSGWAQHKLPSFDAKTMAGFLKNKYPKCSRESILTSGKSIMAIENNKKAHKDSNSSMIFPYFPMKFYQPPWSSKIFPSREGSTPLVTVSWASTNSWQRWRSWSVALRRREIRESVRKKSVLKPCDINRFNRSIMIYWCLHVFDFVWMIWYMFYILFYRLFGRLCHHFN